MSLMVSVDVKHHGRRSLAWHGVPSRHDKSLQPTAFTEGLMLTSSASRWYETRPDCNIQYTNIQRGGRKFLGHFKRRLGSQISLESVSYLANNANNYLQQNWVWLVSVKGDSSVHDRWFCRHQFSSRWYLCAGSEKPICTPPRLSEVCPTLPLKRFQCSSDWRRPSLVFSRKIIERFLFPRLSPPGDRWCDVLGFVSASALRNRRVHVVPRKLDLDQTSMAFTHTERHKCDETHFLGFVGLI